MAANSQSCSVSARLGSPLTGDPARKKILRKKKVGFGLEGEPLGLDFALVDERVAVYY